MGTPFPPVFHGRPIHASPNPRFGGREIDASISRPVLRRPAYAHRIGSAAAICTRPKTGVAKEREVDVIVMGGGPVGENVADRAVQGGLTAAIVEQRTRRRRVLVLGLHAVEGAAAQRSRAPGGRQVPGAREAVTGELDVAAVLRRRDAFASHWNDDGQVSGWTRRAPASRLRARITAPTGASR